MKFKTEFRVLKLKDIVPPPYNPREDIVKGSDGKTIKVLKK